MYGDDGGLVPRLTHTLHVVHSIRVYMQEFYVVARLHIQSCQLSRILRETHAFLRNLTLTRIITSISRAPSIYTRAIVRDGIRTRDNQRHVQLQTEIPHYMDDSALEGPSATIKQKIKDRESLRKWSGVAIIVVYSA